MDERAYSDVGEKISTIRKTTGEYSQDNYDAVVHAIQSEWIFLQRITWDTGDAFEGVEKMIWENFLPRLFLGKTKTLSTIVGTISTMPIKVDGLSLLNPVTPVKENYLSYQKGRVELIRYVPGGGTFSNADQLRTLGEEMRDGQKDREVSK